MKIYKVILGLAFFFVTSAAFSQGSSPGYSMESTGHKLLIHSDFLGGDDIEIHQGKLIEKDPEGAIVQQMNVKSGNNTWSSVLEQEGLISSRFHAGEQDSPSLRTTIYFGTQTTTWSEPLPCSGCKPGTSGFCKNPKGRCGGTPGACPNSKFTECPPTVMSIKKDTLRPSFVVKWRFQDPANTLHYQLEFRTEKAKVKGKKDGESVSLQDSGILELKSEAIIRTTDNIAHQVPVSISSKVKGKKTIVEFEFPAFEEGSTLEY